MSPALDRVRVSFLESLELGGKSPLTLDSYGRHLAEFEDWLRENEKPLTVDEIQSSHVRGFLLHLTRRPKRPGYQHRAEPEGGLAPETLRHYYWTLVSFFNWCEDDRLLNGHKPMHNVAKPAKEQKEIRTLSDQEVQRFLDLLDKPEAKKRTLYVSFCLMARLGLRIGEVVKLRLSDVNLERGSILVRGKGKKERRLPIPNSLEKVLTEYIAEVRSRFANGSDRLLVSYTGSPLLTSSLRRSFHRYAKRAGIAGTPHVLRHSFATKAVRNGVSPFVLMRLLGHSDIKTTERYVHAASVDDMAAALGRMDWV